MTTPPGDLIDIVTSGAGPGRAARWLESVAGCTVRVAEVDQPPPEVTHVPPVPVLSALAEGRQRQPYAHTAEVTGSGEAVWLLVAPCGVDPPPRRRRLLWAWRDRPWDTAAQQAAARAAGAVHTLGASADVATREAATTTAAMGTRVATLRHFLAGELPQATPAVDALIPGLGSAGAGQIAVLETTAADRPALITEMDRALRWDALVVACTETTTQAVVVRAGEGLEDAVRPVLTRRSSRTGGVSLLTPWPRSAAAYGAALAALSGTCQDGRVVDPVAVHDGRAPAVERLGADARLWAVGLLAPLDALDPGERETLLTTAGEVLWWGAGAAARVMGWHRRTVARYMDRLADLTGLDLQHWPHRVALYAAIRLDALPLPPPVPVRRLTLVAALDDSHTQEWAAATLAGLTPVQRRTAVAWLASGRQPEQAAAALDVRRSTLYQRLSRIAARTHTPVTTYPGPAADLALALAAAGDLTLDTPTVDAHAEDHPEAAVDITRPHLSRAYGYCIGSRVHFAADRAAARQVQRHAPDTVTTAQSTHLFYARVCEAAGAAGIRQVLSLASGIPTWPAPHHVMQRHHPAARVVYANADPVVRAHSYRQLYGTPHARTGYILGTIREGAGLLDHPEVPEILDLAAPVLVLLSLTHISESDADIQRLVRELTAPLAAGSLLALTCLTEDHAPAAARQLVAEVSHAIRPIRTRTREQVACLLEGMDIEAPGITPASQWRPDTTTCTPTVHAWAALARP